MDVEFGVSKTALNRSQLYRHCDLDDIPFALSSEADECTQPGIGQERALEAIEFGIGMPHRFYNLYLLGSIGLGKHAALRQFLDAQAATQATPSD